MADRKFLERIEFLNGTGKVFVKSKGMVAVRYSIEVLQEKIESRTSSGVSTINGSKQVRGTIDPIGATIHELFGETLTLVFEDGRMLDFLVTHPNTGSIAPSSEIH